MIYLIHRLTELQIKIGIVSAGIFLFKTTQNVILSFIKVNPIHFQIIFVFTDGM